MVWYCHVMSCHVLSCHVMSCHVMTCHVMSCHVMQCHALQGVAASRLVSWSLSHAVAPLSFSGVRLVAQSACVGAPRTMTSSLRRGSLSEVTPCCSAQRLPHPRVSDLALPPPPRLLVDLCADGSRACAATVAQGQCTLTTDSGTLRCFDLCTACNLSLRPFGCETLRPARISSWRADRGAGC